MSAAASTTVVKRSQAVPGPPVIVYNSFNKPVIFKQEHYILPYQELVKDFYLRRSIQIFVAVIIIMNFVTSAIQSQLLAERGSPTDRLFLAFEYFYVYAFFIELLVNMYGAYFWSFWKSGWNWFDFIIVLVSFLAMYFPDLPAISVLRLFRAFRVVRLFKRVKEMRKIIEGVLKSLPALSYAFIALGLITGIWAIMGVDFFGKMVHNQQEGYYFGNFFRACLSLGQITTFDSWSSGIARDIIYEEGTGAAFYFVTFVFVASIIMMNVLVALLLDNYLSTSDNDLPEGIEGFELTPEQAIEQLVSFVTDNGVSLRQFAQYLRDQSFPDFLANHHLKSKPTNDELSLISSVRSPSAININMLQKEPIGPDINCSLKGIEKQLKALPLAHTPDAQYFSFQEKQPKEIVYDLPYQKDVKMFYLRHSIQILVAVVILMNFVTAAIQAQILPEPKSPTDRIFVSLEYFYVYAFLIELLVNMYGHYLWEFWRSGWNWFDFLIVVVSLLAMYFPDLPAISVLRLFRAFRVVRLFKRVKEMRKIIEGIMRSLPALSYAFIAMGLIMGIWAIMGVDFFGKMEHNGQQGYYFGNFFRALLSLGQITTFDSWSSGIARDIIYEEGTPAALYFVTFVFICGIILMNVLVALLLDNYLSPPEEQNEEGLPSPEEAMEQLSTHIKKNDIDLRRFAKYLNERAFPDYLSNYHNVPDIDPPEYNEGRPSPNVLHSTPRTYPTIVEMQRKTKPNKPSSQLSVNLADLPIEAGSSSSSLGDQHCDELSDDGDNITSSVNHREGGSCDSKINLGEINEREDELL